MVAYGIIKRVMHMVAYGIIIMVMSGGIWYHYYGNIWWYMVSLLW